MRHKHPSAIAYFQDVGEKNDPSMHRNTAAPIRTSIAAIATGSGDDRDEQVVMSM